MYCTVIIKVQWNLTGYLLMRRAIEDHLRKIAEKEIVQQQKAREEAEKLMEVMPMMALIRIVDKTESTPDKVYITRTLSLKQKLWHQKE